MSTDQREFSRQGIPDVGAFEFEGQHRQSLRFEIVNGHLEIEDLEGVNDRWRLVRDGSDVVLLNVVDEDAELGRVALNDITGQILVMSRDGDDELTVDLTAGDLIPTGGLSFDGGQGTDDLQILDNGGTATYTPGAVNSNSGSVLLEEGLVTYTNVAPQTLTVTGSDDLTVQLPNGLTSEIFVEQTAVAGQMQIKSQALEFTTFVFTPPAIRLTLLGGSASETITIASFADNAFAGGLTINGGGGTDTIRLNGNLLFAADRDLQVTAETVTVGADAVFATQGSGDIFVTTNSLTINTTASLSASDQVAIRPQTAGHAMSLGSKVSDQLSLTDAELDRITAGEFLIGNSSSGAMTVSAAITHGNNLSLVTGGGITFNQAVTMAADRSFSAESFSTSAPINLANANADITASGSGAVSLTAVRNIALASGSSVSTQSGDLTLLAHAANNLAQNFVGVHINSAQIQTASGAISVTGTGGRTGTNLNVGVWVAGNSGRISSTGTGTINVTAQGGIGTGSHIGVGLMVGTVGAAGARISSVKGDITLTGQAGSSTSGNDYGILVQAGGIVESTGTGTDAARISLIGTGGTGSRLNHGVAILDNPNLGVAVRSIDGDISITGTGGTGGTVANIGVDIHQGARVMATGNANITIDGQGGPGTQQNYGIYLGDRNTGSVNAAVTSVHGDITLRGIGGSGTSGQHAGVFIASTTGNAGQTLQTTGNGNISITGTGFGSDGHGVQIGTSTTIGTTGSGNIEISGTSASASDIHVQSNLSTVGTQTFHDRVVLGANVNFTGTDILFSDGVGGEFNLTLTPGNTATFPTGTTSNSTGTTTLASGTTFVNGQIVGAGGTFTALNSATLAGVGSIARQVNLANSARLASGNSPGILTVTNIAWNSGTFFDVEIAALGTPGTDYDQLVATGTVSLGNATLNLIDRFPVSEPFDAEVGDTFVIVSANSITGAFAGLPHGAELTFKGVNLRIEYTSTEVRLVVPAAGSMTAVNTGGNLVIQDRSDVNNAFRIFRDGDFLVVGDEVEGFLSVPSAWTLSSDRRSIRRLASQVTGGIVFLGKGGRDSLTVDLTGGDAIPVGGVRFEGGASDFPAEDSLKIVGGDQGTVTYSYTAARDGSVELSSYGSISWVGVQPIVNEGLATNIVFDLAEWAGDVRLEDDGTSGNGLTRLRGVGDDFSTVDFISPTGTVTINPSSNSQVLTIGSIVDLKSSLTAGGDTDWFGHIRVTGTVNLKDGDLAIYAGRIVMTSGITANNIVLDADTGSHLSGIFTGVTIVSRVAARGNLEITGRGGDNDSMNYGVHITHGSHVSGGNDVTVYGHGGNSTGNNNYGVYVSGVGSRITSTGGRVLVEGTGGGSGGSSDSHGVYVFGGGEISSAGTGVDSAVSVIGYVGNAGGISSGVLVSGTASRISSSGGAVLVEGRSGGTDASRNNRGVIVSSGGEITSEGTNPESTVTVKGWGGVAVGYSNVGVLVADIGSAITSSGGAVLVDGTGGGSGNSSDNYGVHVFGGAEITNAGTSANATVTVKGLGGSTDGRNAPGVVVFGTGSRINSSGGAVFVEGRGGFTRESFGSVGVSIFNGGEITSTGMDVSATVTVIGYGSGANGGDSGVTVSGTGSRISSSGGAVFVEGHGGDFGAGTIGYGVSVSGGGEITSDGSGVEATVTVIGNGGTSSTGTQYGILIRGDESQITSSGGDVHVTGLGGNGEHDNYGIYVTASGMITAGLSGKVTVSGTGGAGSGSRNYGVYISESGSRITSSGGNVLVTGVGGDGTSDNHGVYGFDGMITGASLAQVSVHGTGGSASGSSNHGVLVAGSNGRITSGGGDVTVSGSGGAGSDASHGVVVLLNGAQITAGGSGSVTVSGIHGIGSNSRGLSLGLGGAVVTSSGAAIRLHTDSLSIDSNSSVNSGIGTTSIRPLTSGSAIDIGGNDVIEGSPRTLGISGAELDQVSGGTIVIGDEEFTGAIRVTGDISHANDDDITVRTSRSILFQSGSRWTSQSGDLSFLANQQTVQSGGSFVGIDVVGATVSTAHGHLVLSGRGGDTGASNHGVRVRNNGVVRVSGSGVATITGYGGRSSGNTNYGVHVTSSGQLASASTATLNVSGLGGGIGTSNNKYGVFIASIGLIESSGNSIANISGTGGATRGSDNYGVRVNGGSAQITAGNGSELNVTGTGGGSGSSARNYGVNVSGGGAITSSGTGRVSVHGISGTSSGSGQNGIYVVGTGSRIASGTGPLSISGIGSGNHHGISLHNNALIASGGSGALTISTDSLNISNNTSTIRAGSTGQGQAIIRPLTSELPIRLGASDVFTGVDRSLGLSPLELDRIFANGLILGDVLSGSIELSADVVRSQHTNLELRSGQEIRLNGRQINTAGGNLKLSAAAAVQTLIAGSDIRVGRLEFAQHTLLPFQIDGKEPGINHTVYRVEGSIDLTGAQLSLTGSLVPATGDRIVLIENDGNDAVSGHFEGLPEGSVVMFNGRAMMITYQGGTGNDVSLIPATVTGFDVQKGIQQRSFIRVLDVEFSSSAVAHMMRTTPGRMRLIRYDLNGLGMGVNVPLVMSGGSDPGANRVTFDFGVNGITGNRNSSAGDGYYVLEIDLHGNGQFEDSRRFYRLFGDTNGDRVVDQLDVDAVQSRVSSLSTFYPGYLNGTISNWDINGDGYINSTDVALVRRHVGRRIKWDLWLDD